MLTTPLLWAAGTVDTAEITPATASVLPSTNKRFEFNAQNTTGSTLTNYTVNLAFSNGLSISNLTVSPAPKSSKIDSRKQLITIQWLDVAADTIVNASWDASSVTEGSYTISDGGLTYKIGKTSYTGTVNTATLNVANDTTPPANPTGLSANIGDSQVTLGWNSNTEPDLAGYDVYRSTISGGPYSKLTATPLTSTVNDYTDTTAINGTLYYYVITAIDAVGNTSSYSSEASATPLDAVPPSIPTGLSATTTGDAQVSLNWDANSDSDLAGYDVYRTTVTGGPYSRLTTSSLASDITTYVDTTVSNGTQYYYVITAVDTSGNYSAYSAEANVSPVDLSGPEIIQIHRTDITSDSVTIRWFTDEPATSQVEYGVSENNYDQSSPINTTLTQTHSVTLTGLNFWQVYHYRVLSQDVDNNLSSSVDRTFLAGEEYIPIANPGGPYIINHPNTTVMFDGSASRDPEGVNLTYRWDFGDGSTATGVNPSHTYANTGRYTVSLIVNDGLHDSDPATTTVMIGKPIVYISGNISGPLTADNQYMVTDDITVSGTLTLEPGVEVIFPRRSLDTTKYFSMTVNGSLIARGTSAQPIRFTADSGQGCSSYDWVGIKINYPGANVSIDHAVVECADRGVALYNVSGSGSITNSVIQKNRWGIFTSFYTNFTSRTRTNISGNTIKSNSTGILVFGRSNPQILNNEFHDGIVIQASPDYSAYPNPLINGNSMLFADIKLTGYPEGTNTSIINATGNWWGTTDTSFIRSRITDHMDYTKLPYVNFGAFLDGPDGLPVNPNYLYAIQQDRPLDDDVEYMVINPITVPVGNTLTVNPGTSLTFPGNERLTVEGSLIVKGSPTNPARFSNGQSVRNKGSWFGIEIKNTATASIDNAVIVDADYGVRFTNSSGTVSNSSLQGNQIGIYVYGDATPTISNNVIKSNDHGLYIRGTSTLSTPGPNPNPVIYNNSIYNNNTYNYFTKDFVDASNTTLDATNNWWGTTDTTLIDQAIYDATDEPVASPTVIYTPYLDLAPIDEQITPPILDVAPTLVGFSPYTLTGTAPAGSTVQIYLNSSLHTSTVAASDGSFSVDLSLFEGNNTIHATAVLVLEESDLSNVLDITLDTLSPAIDVSLVTVTEPLSGQVSVTGAAGATESDTTVKLTNPRNGASVSGGSNADGSFSFTLAASPADSLVIYSVDATGNQSPARILTVPGTAPPLTVAITTPTAGSTVITDNLLVSGTLTAPTNSGITVNGVVVQVIGDQFHANNIALQPGSNTITATVTTADGQSISDSITVTYTPPAEPGLVTLSASPDIGIAALDVTFSVTADSSITISQIDLDVDGDDIADIITTDLTAPLTYTYPTPGAYTAKVTVMDSLGNLHPASTTIVVHNITHLRNQLEAVYYTMLERLRDGNIDGAMQSITASVQDKYRDVFTTIEPNLASIVDNLGTLESSTIGADFAELAIVRNENNEYRAYLVYLIRGEDGVWRIDGM